MKLVMVQYEENGDVFAEWELTGEVADTVAKIATFGQAYAAASTPPETPVVAEPTGGGEVPEPLATSEPTGEPETT